MTTTDHFYCHNCPVLTRPGTCSDGLVIRARPAKKDAPMKWTQLFWSQPALDRPTMWELPVLWSSPPELKNSPTQLMEFQPTTYHTLQCCCVHPVCHRRLSLWLHQWLCSCVHSVWNQNTAMLLYSPSLSQKSVGAVVFTLTVKVIWQCCCVYPNCQRNLAVLLCLPQLSQIWHCCCVHPNCRHGNCPPKHKFP